LVASPSSLAAWGKHFNKELSKSPSSYQKENNSDDQSLGSTDENRALDSEDSQEFSEPQKNWNFPKMHLCMHLFNDIAQKGVTRNFSTKPNKKMHGTIRKSYKQRTNFKNFGKQVGPNILFKLSVNVIAD
jgi:hypothetical protein